MLDVSVCVYVCVCVCVCVFVAETVDIHSPQHCFSSLLLLFFVFSGVWDVNEEWSLIMTLRMGEESF